MASADAKVHKIRISDPALAGKIVLGGGQLIADYGNFQLFEVDAAAARDLANNGAAEAASEQNIVTLNAGPLDTSTPEVKALRRPVGAVGGKRLHLVHFAGPVKPEWRSTLEQSGVQIVSYIPFNAYLVYGDGPALAQMQTLARSAAYVQWDGEYLDDYKIHPRARTLDEKGNPQKPTTDWFAIQLVADSAANAATLQVIDRLKVEPIRKQSHVLNYLNIIVRVPPERLKDIAAQPEVISIQPYFKRIKMDERQAQILAANLSGNGPAGPGYLAWLASKGFTQAQFTSSGFAVDVSDSGVDNGTISPNHFGLYESGATNQSSRFIYSRLEGTPNLGSTRQGCDGHGNLNSHIIAGYNDQPNGFPHTDSLGFHYGLGVCPFVKVGSSVLFDPDNFTDPDYANLQSQAYNDGARVSNNSWGADTAGAYDVDAQEYDALVRDAQPAGSTFPSAGNQQMVILFAAGNSGPASQTVGSPGTAKNIITVGAAENVHSHSTANGGNDASGNDGCDTADVEANNCNDIASFSSRGPCSDGRKKPDIVAPGTHVTGGVAQSSPPPLASGNGSANSCFKATGVCALSGGGTTNNANDFFPLGQQFYTTSSGTSHSTPAAAGSCALVRQFFLNLGSNAPSPAMTKAFLMNSARYMNGVSANDSLWSPNQGMGEVNLGFAFDSVSRAMHDQLPAEKFTATGQTRTFTGTIVDPSKPFRVTVAWTDAPGSTSGNAFNNNLDLTVTVGGNTYKGNVFNGAFSVTGGNADTRNNVENIFLPAGFSGTFSVIVTAANINSDGVPNEAPALDQDFALIIYNATEASVPVISTTSTAVAAEGCSPTNNAIDPGETVTVNFALSNLGTSNTSNLVATLQNIGGLSGASGAQTYGALIPGDLPVSRSFSFTASGSCGSTITPTFLLQDGAQNHGTVSFVLQLGQVWSVFSENFDGVSRPNLPANWTSSSSGALAAWFTTNFVSDTSPNAAFSAEASAVGVNELVTPPINLPAMPVQMSFRHSFDLEAGSGTTAYDGGVLEIKIGGGSFTDLISAGGSFLGGGYTHVLSTTYQNPLGGRNAWSGSSSGLITTTALLPASASGQTVQLRWRCGSDTSVSGRGWYLDSISLFSRTCCGDIVPPIAAFSATPTSGSNPLTVLFTDTSGGTITNHFWNLGNGLTTNTTLGSLAFTYNSAGTNTVSLTVSGPAGTNKLTRTNYIIITNEVSLIVSNRLELAAEGCTNGFVDPGETVTMNFGLKNIGTASTTNLVATLQAAGGITSPSGPQTYGVLTSGGAEVVKPFTFTAVGGCGAANTATLQLQDGALNLGSISFVFMVGQPGNTFFTQNFDTVISPDLPASWTTSTNGPARAWSTTNFLSDSSPNSAFSPSVSNPSVAELVSPVMTLPPGAARLIFRHRYDMEYGFDGGVLDLKIGNGPFTNIAYAGATFVANGYNSIISSSYFNPLAGQPAWSGTVGSFVTTIINLPPAASGQDIQLRWRIGSDVDVVNSGWYLDSIGVSGYQCCANAPTITLQPQNQTAPLGGAATFSVAAIGTAPLSYQWLFNGTNLVGATSSTFTRTNVQLAHFGGYFVVVTNFLGSATSSVATLSLGGPTLLSPQNSNGAFTFTLSGAGGFSYLIEASTNLSNWSTLTTITNISGQAAFTDTAASNYLQRFYRARLLP